jgi:adenine-specific DNA-methyltransferase
VVRNRPEALILDFFAGSGTTLHATCLLNAEDGGRRRSIMVTNNEVSEKLAAHLHSTQDVWRGDPEFEAHGIFEAVTRPRCTAVVTGKRPDGDSVGGKYRDGRPISAGFAENVEFFRLDYRDPDELDLDRRSHDLEPIMWLGAGATGEYGRDNGEDWLIPDGAGYAVLLNQTKFRQFIHALQERPRVRMVYLVTDSPEAYAEMSDGLPRSLRIQMLYHDYRQCFRTLANPGV